MTPMMIVDARIERGLGCVSTTGREPASAAAGKPAETAHPQQRTEDLKKFDVPTLVLHGDDDPIVPIAASALLSYKLIRNATLKVCRGAHHGLCTTLKDQVNEDLLAFIKE
jgi:pimeloyl-ACP methyl ester carboxylesterase